MAKVAIKRIAITGAAGQIAYQLLFRIASGELLGKEQPIALHLLELPSVLGALEGVKMELMDCAFPLLHSVKISADPYVAFQEIDYALLIGSKPRSKGMERKDLLHDNAAIFAEQGKALNSSAKPSAKVFVVGNPCNTNCLIALHHAPKLDPNHFYAMTRLDQNRAVFFLAQEAQKSVGEVTNLAIWGNHSATLVPDFYHAQISDQPLCQVITDHHWLKTEFLDLVRQRGAAIIQARGKSSAASAAQALIATIQDIEQETANQRWYSVGRLSDGNPYQIAKGLIFSFPTRTTAKKVETVSGLELDLFLREKIEQSEQELLEERELIKYLLQR